MITDPKIIDFANVRLRPVVEQASALTAAIDKLADEWVAIGGKVPNDIKEQVADVSPERGRENYEGKPFTGLSLHVFVAALSDMSATYKATFDATPDVKPDSISAASAVTAQP